MRRRIELGVVAGLALFILGFTGGAASAQTPPLPPEDLRFAPQAEMPDIPAPPLVQVPEPEPVPDVSISVSSETSALSRTVAIVLMLTVAAVAPAILLLMTSFTRFVVVLTLTRNAIGVQSIPPNQVLLGLSLFLTVFVMNPVFAAVNEDAVQPLLAGEIDQSQAFEAGFAPLRQFMLAQTRPEDMALFVSMAQDERPANPDEVSAATLIPAYVISELRTAFVIGFVIFVPFVIIDLIVAAVLMSMGMVMLPPVFISLPLKLLLFVLVDGWALIVGSVVQSVSGVGG